MDLSELAPGLQTLPDTFRSVRSAFADGDLTSLADPARIDSYVPLVVVGLFVYLTGCLLFRSLRLRLFPERRQLGKDDKPEKHLPAMGKPSIFHRLFHRKEKPVTVGGVTFDRAWRHVGIVATTGARKSTLLAMLAEQLGVPVVIITGDHAPPLLNFTYSVGGWVWQARGGIGWYPWGGPLELAVQRAEFMHPAHAGDVGVGRSMFKHAARIAWSAADERGDTRTLEQLIEALPTAVKGQVSAMMAENWTARLRELQDSLGDSLGSELDIVEALRTGTSVMVSLNSFQDVANRKRFASIAILEALRAADTLGNIGVVFDEVGLIGADLFDDAVRTFRVRRVVGCFASQIAEDFPPAVRGNVNVWFLGQQSGGDAASRRWSSDTTFGLVPPEHFGEHHMPQGRFYVVHGGRVESAQIPTWVPRHPLMPRALPQPVSRITPSPERMDTGPPTPDPSEPAPLPRKDVELVYGPPPMPAYWRGEPQLENIWLHHTFPQGLNGCYESTYRLNNRGRPQCSYQNQAWTTYILSLALSDGIDLGFVRMLTSADELTVDHLEHCENKRCDRADHLGWETRSENTKLFFERRRTEKAGVVLGVSTAAD